MKKILLIEDRTQRQQLFMNETKINLDLYSDIIDNCINDKYNNLLEELKNDSFSLDNYSIIISHKSAFGDDNSIIVSKLKKYCENTNKVLVFFSGGIDANYYLKDEKFELIELNSKTLYSQNLQIFLDDFRNENLHPLILTYGDKWKLNILLNILERLNIFIEKTEKDKVLYSTFIRDNPDIELLETLNIELYKIKTEDRKVYIKEIVKLKNSIDYYIEEDLKYA